MSTREGLEATGTGFTVDGLMAVRARGSNTTKDFTVRRRWMDRQVSGHDLYAFADETAAAMGWKLNFDPERPFGAFYEDLLLDDQSFPDWVFADAPPPGSTGG